MLTLAENLELENQALLQGDADDPRRRRSRRPARRDAGPARGREASGRRHGRHYRIDDVRITLLVPFGRQTGLSLGLESRGTVTEETYDASGDLVARRDVPFAKTFVMRRATGGRWLNVAVLPLPSGG